MTDDEMTVLRTRLDTAIELLRGARALADDTDDDTLFCVAQSIRGALMVLEYAQHLLPETGNDQRPGD